MGIRTFVPPPVTSGYIGTTVTLATAGEVYQLWALLNALRVGVPQCCRELNLQIQTGAQYWFGDASMGEGATGNPPTISTPPANFAFLLSNTFGLSYKWRSQMANVPVSSIFTVCDTPGAAIHIDLLPF
jgi:hypothetical protein